MSWNISTRSTRSTAPRGSRGLWGDARGSVSARSTERHQPDEQRRALICCHASGLTSWLIFSLPGGPPATYSAAPTEGGCPCAHAMVSRSWQPHCSPRGSRRRKSSRSRPSPSARPPSARSSRTPTSRSAPTARCSSSGASTTTTSGRTTMPSVTCRRRERRSGRCCAATRARTSSTR